MIEMVLLVAFCMMLAGGGIALRFARAATENPVSNHLTRCGDLPRFDDDGPISQRDTLPASAPATWRSSEIGREFGDQPAQTEDPWL